MRNPISLILGKDLRRSSHAIEALQGQIKDRGWFKRNIFQRGEHKNDIVRLNTLKNIHSKLRKETWGARALLGGTIGIGVGANSYKSQKDKAMQNAQLQQAHSAGMQASYSKLLQDPNFPVDAKIKLLENTGVVKLSQYIDKLISK